MSFEPRDFLGHILVEANYLVEASTSLALASFRTDPTLQRAFVRSLEVIGEAAKKLPPDCRDRHPEVEWRAMADMRDRLIHGYFGVDYDLVWDVVRHRIPTLRTQVTALFGEAGQSTP